MALMSMVKKRRAVNPGKKRKMSRLQKLFFGSKRQRAAAQNAGKRKRKRNVAKRRTVVVKRRRKRNVGSILTVLPKIASAGLNLGRKRRRKKNRSSKKVVIINKGATMATRRRKRRSTARRVTRRRRRNYGTVVGRSWSRRSSGRRRRKSNPGVVVRYRSRKRNSGRRKSYRRRNPGMLTDGTTGKVVGILAGLGTTKVVTSFLPAQLQTGIVGYMATGVVAWLQGQVAAKVTKSTAFGNNMMIGGLAYLAAKILNDFLPSVGSYVGISGMRGMGLIGGSSFYNPQVNQNGSMGTFVVPSAVQNSIMSSLPAATANAGMGRLRRTGRLM